MTADLDKDLTWCVRFALQQYPYMPPRTRNTDERDAYFLRVAEAVVAQIKLSWTIEPPAVIRRKPPVER
jgi:hypothetical protein